MITRVIGLGRCMKKKVGELINKVEVITEKVDVYTISLIINISHFVYVKIC